MSDVLRNMRNISIGAELNAANRTINNYYNSYDTLIDKEHIERQEALGAKAMDTQVWTALEKTTADIRKRMTLKYRVEF